LFRSSASNWDRAVSRAMANVSVASLFMKGGFEVVRVGEITIGRDLPAGPVAACGEGGEQECPPGTCMSGIIALHENVR
jgi:hypothetical protein